MRYLELLAPARNMEIGIAAIDCGADAVYIAGPDFGARKAASNSFEDIEALCLHAHKFGVRIFVTYNIEIREDEAEELHAQMLKAQQAGADALIVRDMRALSWEDILIPIHASTQCAIRTVEDALRYESLGCSRIILERELSLETIRKIRQVVQCEVEFFVHGALCVCYSGECRLSEQLCGKSADRGECVQACRSLYDLIDEDGRMLLRNKAILSLKDYNLKARLEDLAAAGICSFKIEGRLKNASYVKNVVRDYSLALDALVARHPELYARASFGKVRGGFEPDTTKTFNRGYTELFIDGKRGKWSSMDTPKSMGECIGTIGKIRRVDAHTIEISVRPKDRTLALHNGDGFAFVTSDGITGFRGDVCENTYIRCKDVPDLKEGTLLYRNINTSFEKTLETQVCHREIPVSLSVRIHGKYGIDITATTEDGRVLPDSFNSDMETAQNAQRAEVILREQLSKRSGDYVLSVDELVVATPGGSLPLLSASTINSMRRLVAEDLGNMPCNTRPMLNVGRRQPGSGDASDTVSNPAWHSKGHAGPLMRTKYCVRYELGLCPRFQGGRPPEQLYIVNNGRRFALDFDCAACEMSVNEVQK